MGTWDRLEYMRRYTKSSALGCIFVVGKRIDALVSIPLE
jgi:hypothetical protein